jgi:hypothetical protein
MRQSFNKNVVFILTLGLIVCAILKGYTQNDKKKARVTLGFNKIMEEESNLTISAKFKGEEGFEPAIGLVFEVFTVFELDSLVNVGRITTNMEGEGKFIFDNFTSKNADSTGTYNYLVSATDSREFSDVEKSITFKDADIYTEVITMEGGINAIKAILIDSHSKDLIADQQLQLQVQRLFRPLRIGEEFIATDETGTIIVPIDPGIPGVHGDLTIEVVLNESEEYGTLIARITGNLGTPVVDQSTFEERTMWSPGTKTPIFLLLSFNSIMIGIWIIILFLIFNLTKIYKSKN